MSTITHEDIGNLGRLYCGDWIEVMKILPDNSVDSVITDPPGGINFMNMKWDSDKGGRDKWIAWLTEGMKECLRVLKPGGMALVWAIPRTAHWTATAIEDAGFEIRDKIYHIQGAGFPKSLAIDKAIDQKMGKERKVIGQKYFAYPDSNCWGKAKNPLPNSKMFGVGSSEKGGMRNITAPATPEAQRFSGYGTGLKPAVEEWVLAMKPLEGTFAESALRHGIAGLNIDGCRIKTEHQEERITKSNKSIYGGSSLLESKTTQTTSRDGSPTGRWPSNLLISHSPECREIGVKKVKGAGWSNGDKSKNSIFKTSQQDFTSKHYTAPDGTETVPAYECATGCPCGHVWATKELTECPECGCHLTEWVCAVKMLDEQAGELKSGLMKADTKRQNQTGFTGNMPTFTKDDTYGDSGGPSRFYYCAKSSRTERELGLKGHIPCVKCGGLDTDWHLDDKGEKVKCVRNDHSTVKPLKIMEYLCRLTQTPNGGVVLDPFLGSGTTAVACVKTGRKFIGIDNDSHFIEISKWAIEAAGKRYGQQKLFKEA